MANINLREWRQELREQRQKEFLYVLFFVAAVAAGLAFLWIKQVEGLTSDQRARNNFLTQQISVQTKQIKEIENLKDERSKLISRMEVIQSLQGDRPIIVRLFDELVKTLPEGVYYESLDRKGDRLAIVGVADKASSISDLLRNLDKSEWFEEAFLQNVTALDQRNNDGTGSRFKITVKQATPQIEEAGA